MNAVSSLCLAGSASKIQPTSDQKYLKEILQAHLPHTDYVCSYSLFPTQYLHCTRCVSSQKWLECIGYLQTLYALYRGLGYSWILVPTGISGISLPNGPLKMKPNDTSTCA